MSPDVVSWIGQPPIGIEPEIGRIALYIHVAEIEVNAQPGARIAQTSFQAKLRINKVVKLY